MSYRLEVGLTLLLASAIGVAIWAANRAPRTPQFDLRPSTYLSGPDGSKGLYEVLRSLGRVTERRRTPLFTLAEERAPPHRPAILVLLNPAIGLQDAELQQVVRFVRGGGAVLATGWGGGVTRCAGWRTQHALPSPGEDSIAVRLPSPGARLWLPRAERVLTRIIAEDTVATALQGLVKGEAGSETGICGALVPFQQDTVIAAVNHRPVILRLSYRGGGTITLVADPGWFTNRVWRSTDVPIVALPLLTPRPERPGRVAWDEYHQGFSDKSATSLAAHTWSWLRSSPTGWAVLQLVAVGLIWLALAAVRFGPARSVIERRRRSPLEHLEALGAGLESADDADTAVRRLALGLRRRLGRGVQSNDENVVPWLESLELATRGPKGRAAVRRLRNFLTVRDRDPARVLHAAQAVEDVWEELRPRTTRNAS
ncbi:MAG: hypothetical protein AUI89_00565 [Gemmatimonadetes bacterium 13_1_40CM_3_65_8]|nr:MAG: hypothetical protein AUI89_00565 [Gemmatimonadetes bacterium 13_1_40CM_3_65_8]